MPESLNREIFSDRTNHDATRQNVLVYTVHKAASKFLTRLIVEVRKYLDMNHYYVNTDNFNWIDKTGWKNFIQEPPKSGCFGPIRLKGVAEMFLPDDLEQYRIVAHMRDPRDVLTSLFYSHTYSHSRNLFDPGDEARSEWEAGGIDRFVLDRALGFKSRYDIFCSHLHNRKNVLVLRYEDLVTDFETWLRQFLTVFSDWADEDSEQNSLMTLSDLHCTLYAKFQSEFTALGKENIYKHKRQVTPGDHRRKLRPDTILQLNTIFSEALEALGHTDKVP